MKTIMMWGLLLFAAGLHAQTATPTWFKVAVDGQTVTLPAGAVVRYGAAAGSPIICGSSSGKTLTADAWVMPKTPTASFTADPSGLGLTADPAYCTVKEIDVQETAVAQTVTVNGQTVTVPALPPTTFTYTLACTATLPASGPPPSTIPLDNCTLTAVSQ